MEIFCPFSFLFLLSIFFFILSIFLFYLLRLKWYGCLLETSYAMPGFGLGALSVHLRGR